jgi:hypothetical protein
MNVIDSNKLERDMQISLRNLRKLDCTGKPVPTFPHPALATHFRHHLTQPSAKLACICASDERGLGLPGRLAAPEGRLAVGILSLNNYLNCIILAKNQNVLRILDALGFEC